jgi:hypothetical protein
MASSSIVVSRVVDGRCTTAKRPAGWRASVVGGGQPARTTTDPRIAVVVVVVVVRAQPNMTVTT